MGIADELITRGWTQRWGMDPDGRVCLMGAARCALGLHIEPGMKFFSGVSLPADVMNELRRLMGHSVGAGWNDDPERTFDEVLRVAKMADEILDGMQP